MFYHIFKYLGEYYDIPGSGMFQYISFRAAAAIILALLIVIIFGRKIIDFLRRKQIGEDIRDLGLEGQLQKRGTPTMGGVIILVAVSLTCLLMGKLTTELVLVLLATLATGVLGLIDDLTSVTHGRSLGLTPHAKMIGLTIICVTFTVLAVNWCGVAPEIRFPGGLTIDLGVLSTTIFGLSFPWLYLVFCWLMIAGLSNAVNLTDGLDGLAGGTSMIAMLAMAAMAFLHGDVNLSIFCTACAGACLGFLWFNCYPASIFMGDTGSMFIGYMLAAISIFGAVKSAATIALLVPAVALGLPIMDTAFAIVRRYTNGRPIFQPDKGHLHHRLLAMGLSQRQAVLLMYVISAVLGIAAILLTEVDGYLAAGIIACIISGVALGAKKIGILNDR